MITGMPAAEFQAAAGACGGEGRPGRPWRTCLTGTAEVVSGDLLLRQALAVLDAHVTSKATRRCRECGSPGPCWRREPAVAAFSRSLRPALPPAADDEPPADEAPGHASPASLRTAGPAVCRLPDAHS
jgi:hypothetical protein